MSASEYRPQLATVVREPPPGDAWLHEIKYDGYRIGCLIRHGRATLISRNGLDWTKHFPSIADAAGRLRVRDALLDGEVAVVLPDGRTSFQALQHASNSEPRTGTRTRNQEGEPGTLVYFIFDLLRLDGERIDTLPLEERKARLAALLDGQPSTSRLKYAAHVAGMGRAFFEEARRLGLEGIVSKRRDLPHRPGRHDGWLKTKCVRRQEFVVGGFTDPDGTRAGLGALLIGVYDNDGRLIYAGRVGTGFTQASAVELRARLDRMTQETSPFSPASPGALARRAHWVTPDLVAEVAFTEWTGDGMIRHPSFQGLRLDKKTSEVRREQ